MEDGSDDTHPYLTKRASAAAAAKSEIQKRRSPEPSEGRKCREGPQEAGRLNEKRPDDAEAKKTAGWLSRLRRRRDHIIDLLR